MVIATSVRTALTFRKFGPPESPKHVPPSPVEGFCDSRIYPPFSASKLDRHEGELRPDVTRRYQCVSDPSGRL